VTLWELMASIEGHNRVHGGETPPEPPSADDLQDMIEQHSQFLPI